MDEDQEVPHESLPTASGDQTQHGSPPDAVDVEQLAERVYTLMRDELRLERARGINGKSFRRG